MSDHLTNDQIALLCKIGEADAAGVTEHPKRDLEVLISAGYVQRTTEPPPESGLRLTAKALAFLSERGVGLNEG